LWRNQCQIGSTKAEATLQFILVCSETDEHEDRAAPVVHADKTGAVMILSREQLRQFTPC
jgi:hypothetical protein